MDLHSDESVERAAITLRGITQELRGRGISAVMILEEQIKALEQYRKDAERWRWLRAQGGWPDTEAAMLGAAPEDFDRMADAHMNSASA